MIEFIISLYFVSYYSSIHSIINDDQCFTYSVNTYNSLNKAGGSQLQISTEVASPANTFTLKRIQTLSKKSISTTIDFTSSINTSLNYLNKQSNYQVQPNQSPIISQTSIIPTFHLDHNSFTPSFILPVDRNQVKIDIIHFQAKFKESIKHNHHKPQLFVPKPTCNYCYICKETYKDYLNHVNHSLHLKKSKATNAHKYILEITAKNNGFKRLATNNLESQPPLRKKRMLESTAYSPLCEKEQSLLALPEVRIKESRHYDFGIY